MPQQRTTRATYADLLAVPDHQVAELIDGELVVTPRPAIPHARASSRLGIALAPFDRGGGGDDGWVLLDEPELHFASGRRVSDPDVLVPDLAGWRRSRFPAEGWTAACLSVPPDWVCEVLSPATERIDRVHKATIYGAVGVPYLWFVNPLTRTLEILAREEGRWVQIIVADGEAIMDPPPFGAGGFRLDLSALWDR